MRRTIMLAAAAALLAIPTIASADPEAAGGAAAGAVGGAVVGGAVGGPVGAAVGAGVGGTVGAGTSPRSRDTVIIEKRTPSVSEKSCVRDSLGNMTCTEIRR
jgi:hypothetical protein